MKKKLFIILGALVLSISLLFSYIVKDNKEENNKEISKVEKILSKPDGIQAYTLYGEKTSLSYNDLIEGYEIDSITCKNGTIATYNKEDNSVSLSNIHMPDYCTMDFKKGVYTLTFNSGNLLYDLKDVSNINSEYITYSVKDEVVTVTGKNDDGYGFINARVYLEANNTYIFNCDTNGVWGTDPGTNTVEAFLMLNGEYNTYYHLYGNKKFEFTPSVTGVYWLRLDVNATNKTYTFYNINISKNISSKNIGYKDVYGEFPTYSRDGYMMLGWYLEDGTKVDSTSINNTKRDHSITAKWSRYNYEVKLVVVNGSGSATKTVDHGSSVSFTGISPYSGYTTSGATVSCTGSAGASISGDYLYLSNITEDQTCTVTFNRATDKLTITKGTGVETIYYKINEESSYRSTANSSITLDVYMNSTYYYYGVTSTGYKMSGCTSSNPCSATMTGAVTKSLSATNKYTLYLYKGTGVETLYYKVNGASSYSSSTGNIFPSVTYGTTYYYYGEASTGYTMSTCTSSSPCSGTMGAAVVSKTISAVPNKYTLTLKLGTGISAIAVKTGNSSNYSRSNNTISASVSYGTTYYYYGTPSTGYTMISCTYDNPCSAVMEASDKTITLRASISSYRVGLTVIGGTSNYNALYVNHGSNAVFTITANSGYTLSEDSSSCAGTLSGSTYTIRSVKKDMSCTLTLKNSS